MRKPRLAPPPRRSEVGDPVWEAAASLYPKQGSWTEEEYLRFEPAFPGRVEFVDGTFEFHDMPPLRHERLAKRVRRTFESLYESAGLAEGLQAGLTRKILQRHPLLGTRDRLPDVVVVRPDPPRESDYPLAAGILGVVEVVSQDAKSVRRNHAEKRAEYAAAGISEYWIADPTDPADPFVPVLTLSDGATEYAEHGTFRPGQTATSPSQPGLSCDVAELSPPRGSVQRPTGRDDRCPAPSTVIRSDSSRSSAGRSAAT